MPISNNQHALILYIKAIEAMHEDTTLHVKSTVTLPWTHTYVCTHARTYATAHIVCHGHFATLLMGTESHSYSIMLPSNGNVLPNKLRNHNHDYTVTLKF